MVGTAAKHIIRYGSKRAAGGYVEASMERL